MRSAMAGDTADAIEGLVRARRALRLPIAGETRLVAVEDASRYRDALGTPLPLGLPAALLEPVRDPLLDLVMRYARTHGPVHHRRGRAPSRAERGGRRKGAAACRRRRAPARGRLPARRNASRVVRARRARPDPAPFAGQGAAPGRAGRTGHARPPGHRLAGRDAQAPRLRRHPRHGRDAAGRAARRLAPRERDPAGAHRGLRARRPGHAPRRRRGRVGGRRAARRQGRAPRALSHRCAAAAVASARGRVARPPRAGDRRPPAGRGRLVLRRDPRRRRRRLPARHGRCVVGPGVAGPPDQRRAAGGAGLRRPARTEAAAACDAAGARHRPRLPIAPAGAGQRRGAVVAAERARHAGLADRMEHGPGAAAPHPLRRRHPRGWRRRIHPRRVLGGLRRAPRARRERARPARLLRRRRRRDAVRAAAGARPAALAAPAAGRARSGDPRGGGSSQSLRHAAEVAGARRRGRDAWRERRQRSGSPRPDADRRRARRAGRWRLRRARLARRPPES